ncbi:ATP-binding protein [Roseococcus pinisoli]|uniref:histidine kinase n=1 Tax=Roseococcus pinisoli TaxID=2835040 RepID=A0ABS5QI42_9PROT|nr:ATP-binding protein [Roseococcus pinisoli]MBS7813306.1 PAS domain-containing protein [Roseococcus pinisoli]
MLLGLAALAPGLLLGVGLTGDLALRLQFQAEEDIGGSAEAIGLTVNEQLESVVHVLSALATSPYLDPENRQLAAFHRQAAEVAAQMRSFVILVRTENIGRQAVNTGQPLGGPLPSVPEGAASLTAIREGRPAFVPPTYMPEIDRALPVVAVPVRRGGEIEGALAMPIPLGRLEQALRLPSRLGSSAFILGPGSRLVARQPEPERTITRHAPAWMAEAIGDRPRGVIRGEGLDGQPAVLAFERLPINDWIVVASATLAEERDAWVPPVLWSGLAVVALLGAGWAALRIISRRLTQPLESLVEGQSDPPEGAARVAEFEALATAVMAARNAPRREAEAARRAAAENLQLAREAEDERRLLKSIVQSVPEAIFVKDTELRYVLVNRAAAGAFGRSEDELLGRTDADLAHPEVAREMSLADRAMMNSGMTQEYEARIRLPGHGNEPRTYLTVKAPWRDSTGRIAGLVSVARDVTLRRATEERLRAADEAMRRIARADSLTAMGVGVAHELNQPLTAVANFLRAGARWLQDDTADPARIGAAREAMQEAAAQAQRAGEIVRRLRDFVGRGETEQKVVALGPLVADGVALTCAARGEESLPIALDLALTGCVVMADEVQLQQVFVNLLRNAIEATEGQRDRGLSVSLQQEEGRAVLRFADAGPGIPAEVGERLFEPFVSTKEEGMGIGLAICRAIVEAHAGRIEALAREGGGTVIRIELPLASEGVKA